MSSEANMGIGEGPVEFQLHRPASKAADVPDSTRFPIQSEDWTVDQWMHNINRWAMDKGWWDRPRAYGEILLLVTSEISEAFEELRSGHKMDEIYIKDGKPEGVPIELADAVIRIFDLSKQYNIPLTEALILKMQYNEKRPYRHGNKEA